MTVSERSATDLYYADPEKEIKKMYPVPAGPTEQVSQREPSVSLVVIFDEVRE